MAESIDIRELNIRIEQQSGFVTNLVTGMDQVIVGWRVPTCNWKYSKERARQAFLIWYKSQIYS